MENQDWESMKGVEGKLFFAEETHREIVQGTRWSLFEKEPASSSSYTRIETTCLLAFLLESAQVQTRPE